jgi:hypothetical protein
VVAGAGGRGERLVVKGMHGYRRGWVVKTLYYDPSVLLNYRLIDD